MSLHLSEILLKIFSQFLRKRRFEFSIVESALTLPFDTWVDPIMDILVRSWQDIAKNCKMSWYDIIKRTIFPRNNLLQNLIWAAKNLKGSQQK